MDFYTCRFATLPTDASFGASQDPLREKLFNNMLQPFFDLIEGKVIGMAGSFCVDPICIAFIIGRHGAMLRMSRFGLADSIMEESSRRCSHESLDNGNRRTMRGNIKSLEDVLCVFAPVENNSTVLVALQDVNRHLVIGGISVPRCTA